MQDNQIVADALLKQDEERRRRRDEGEEDEAMDQDAPGVEQPSGSTKHGGDQAKVVARTRVIQHSKPCQPGLTVQLRFTDSEVAEMRSLGLSPRESVVPIINLADLDRDQDSGLSVVGPATDR